MATTVVSPEKKIEPIPGYTWIVLGIPWTFIVVGALLTFAIGVMLPSMQRDIRFNNATEWSLKPTFLLLSRRQ